MPDSPIELGLMFVEAGIHQSSHTKETFLDSTLYFLLHTERESNTVFQGGPSLSVSLLCEDSDILKDDIDWSGEKKEMGIEQTLT